MYFLKKFLWMGLFLVHSWDYLDGAVTISDIYNDLPQLIKENIKDHIQFLKFCPCTFLPFKIRGTAQSLPKSRFFVPKYNT
jgi:hypothetical protein